MHLQIQFKALKRVFSWTAAALPRRPLPGLYMGVSNLQSAF